MSRYKFRRGLSDKLFRDFLSGPCATVLCAGRNAGLDVRLRPNAVSLYFHGRSLASIKGRSRLPAKLSIHHKYLADGRIGDRVGDRSGSYCTFDVDDAFAEAYATQIGAMVERAKTYVHREETLELRLLQCNDGTPVNCFDRQIQMPGRKLRLDLMGLLTDPVPTLVAIEVKRYPDNSIQEVPRQLYEYLGVFDPARAGLASDVARSYQKVCEQLRALGLEGPDPNQISVGMPVVGLVIVSDYKCQSRLLGRAHKLAARLEQPIYLWLPTANDYRIPAPEQWERMGYR